MTPAQKFDESVINYYDDELVRHADTVYRFALAATLSTDAGRSLTKETFRNIAANLTTAGNGDGALCGLLAECWRIYLGSRGQDGSGERAPLLQALKPLAPEARAVLVAVDVAGLSPVESARIFGWNESQLRARLAEARRMLLGSNVEF